MNDTLDTLRHQRDEFASRLADLMNARERLRQAEGDESSILAQIGALGASEIEALRKWASEGGDMPEPDIDERLRLAKALAGAQARAASIKGADVDLEAAAADLSGQLRSVNATIDKAAIEALAARHRESLAMFDAFVVEHVRPKLARALAFHGFLVDQAQAFASQGRDDEARDLYHRAEGCVRSMTSFDFAPTPAEVMAKVSTWSKRYDELVTGQHETPASEEPASNVLQLGSAA